MTGPIVVGVDGTGSGLDAVALATRLARATGDPLIVACVYPEGRRSSGDAAAVRGPAAKALEAAEALAEEAAAEYRTVPSGSPARGLAELAEEEDAAMVVVGSHRGGAFGRVASGGTAERLLHGSGCPVAVAPAATASGSPTSCGGSGWPSSTRPTATRRSATPPTWRHGRACPSPCSRSSASTPTGSCPRPSGPRRRRSPSRCARTTRRRWTGPWPGFPTASRRPASCSTARWSTNSRWSASGASTCSSAAPGATARCAASCSARSRRRCAPGVGPGPGRAPRRRVAMDPATPRAAAGRVRVLDWAPCTPPRSPRCCSATSGPTSSRSSTPGDPARTHGWNVDGHGLWWKVISRNKRCVTLNIGKPEGQEVLRRLAATPTC